MANTNEGKGSNVLEDPIVTNTDRFGDSEDFVRRNKNILTIVLGALALIVAGFFGYKYYIGSRDKEAQAEMFQAVYYFEADSLDKALKGNGKDLGLLDIVEDYSMTPAANLANFYIGTIYLKQGKFDDAITHLKDFSSSDLLVQARAYCLIGDAYLESKDNGSAIEYYKKAAEYKPNEYFTPRYLMKLAFAYELNKDYSAAITAYKEIIEKYYKASEANDAKKCKARAEALASN